MEEEDSRREAAIASTPSLRPDFKPNNTKITQSQLAKFQELHRRRLQLKSKPKTKKKSKGSFNLGKGHVVEESADDYIEHSCVSISIDSNLKNNSPQQQEIPKEPAIQKHRKLHWGLDTKERWERKSNM
ncbi:Plastid hexose transporter [Heracleum sosnowskyi]|uniref:Plastid hexose transporter n=1 Tax=Heracleum sosnowskyi TaxID=360622 RepID=A0AAD8M935_9APIA|nr:Plastid hexose transporter [Heracleum sosnowskyi]